MAPGEGGTSRLTSIGEELGATNSHNQAMLWNRGAIATPISSMVLCSRILFQTCSYNYHMKLNMDVDLTSARSMHSDHYQEYINKSG